MRARDAWIGCAVPPWMLSDIDFLPWCICCGFIISKHIGGICVACSERRTYGCEGCARAIPPGLRALAGGE